MIPIGSKGGAMKYRVLGRTGLKVSEVGLGAWAIGGNAYGNSYGPTDDEESKKALLKAVGLGCNFIDTADVYGYGHSEELLGETLKGVGEEIFIATKVGGNFYSGSTVMDFSTKYIRYAVDQSLLRLKRDYIDLYQLHNPTLEMIIDGEVFNVMDDLKQEGKIRFYGVSIFKPEEGIAAIKTDKPDALQVVYNIFSQAPAGELFPMAKEHDIAIIAREPLGNGFLSGKYKEDSTFVTGDIRANFPPQYRSALVKYTNALRFLEREGRRTMAQAALGFVLGNDAVSVVIPGAKTEEQVEDNLRASDEEPLTSEELEKIRAVLAGP